MHVSIKKQGFRFSIIALAICAPFVAPLVASADITAYQTAQEISLQLDAKTGTNYYGAQIDLATSTIGRFGSLILQYNNTSATDVLFEVELFKYTGGSYVSQELVYATTTANYTGYLAIPFSGNSVASAGDTWRIRYAITNTSFSGHVYFYGTATTTSGHNYDTGGMYGTYKCLQNPPSIATCPAPWHVPYFQINSIPFDVGSGMPYSAYEGFVERDCGVTEVGGCIFNAFGYAFYPSIESVQSLYDLKTQLASTSPFGYVYDFTRLVSEWSALGTSTLAISVELSGLTNFMGATFSSSTVTVLSGSALRTTLGSTMWNFSQTLFSGLLYFGLLLYVYRRSFSIV